MTTLLTYSRPGLEVVVVPLSLRRPDDGAARAAPGRRARPGLHVLLRPRDTPPYRDALALPSVFVGHDTRVHVATRQALASVGISRDAAATFDVGLVDAPSRDPRDRVIALVRLALVRPASAPSPATPSHGATSPAPVWWPLAAAHAASPVLLSAAPAPERIAFDHEALIAAALARLGALAQHSLAPLELLEHPFTLTAAQRAFEATLGRALDKRNFRRKLEALGVLVAAGERPAGGRAPAKLFHLNTDAWDHAAAHAAPPRP